MRLRSYLSTLFLVEKVSFLSDIFWRFLFDNPHILFQRANLPILPLVGYLNSLFCKQKHLIFVDISGVQIVDFIFRFKPAYNFFGILGYTLSL